MDKTENEPAPELPPPGRYGSMTLLPAAEAGNPTAEELTWPIVASNQVVNSTFFEGPPEIGNAMDEELAWPIAPSGEVICPSLTPTVPVTGPVQMPDRSRIGEPLPNRQVHTI